METNIVIGAALACAAGGVLPWISAEAIVIGAALLLPAPALSGLVLACALGQMSAKIGLYGITRWAPRWLPARARSVLQRSEKYVGRTGVVGAAVFSGALASVPPFYLVTLACGVSRVPLLLFALSGTAGTIARYGILVWAGTVLIPR